MSDTENDPLDQAAVDPPTGDGGTKETSTTTTSGTDSQKVNVDPPTGDGGTGGQ